MYIIFRQQNIRNRAYVIDRAGNKIFYGTYYQCQKFIKYMEGDAENGLCTFIERKDCRRVVTEQ